MHVLKAWSIARHVSLKLTIGRGPLTELALGTTQEAMVCPAKQALLCTGRCVYSVRRGLQSIFLLAIYFLPLYSIDFFTSSRSWAAGLSPTMVRFIQCQHQPSCRFFDYFSDDTHIFYI
jgi:hypothetical protein